MGSYVSDLEKINNDREIFIKSDTTLLRDSEMDDRS